MLLRGGRRSFGPRVDPNFCASARGPIACLALLSFLLPYCYAQTLADAPGPVVSTRIDLSTFGYVGLSNMERLSTDESSVSLDYVDGDHVLLTFARRELFKRDASCPPTHGDRMVHAIVLKLPEGKVVKEADWYLHDHRRFLWSLGGGRFLFRSLNTLFTVDSSLVPKQLLQWPEELAWVGVSPDGKQLLLESPVTGSAKAGGAQKNAPQFVVNVLDVNSLTVQRTINLDKLVPQEATSTGYTDALHKGPVWLIRFGPNEGQRRGITRVRTNGVPQIVYTSNNSFVVGRSGVYSTDFSVSAFALSGRQLWRQKWVRSRFFVQPLYASESSRVGMSALRRTMASINENVDDPAAELTPASAALEQVVDVLETASGSHVAFLTVTPAEINGRNVAMSPDGKQVAAIQGTKLEIYSLPPTAAEEQKQFLALQADVPEPFQMTGGADSSLALAADQIDVLDEGDAADEAASIATNKTDGSGATAQTTPVNSPIAAPPDAASARNPAATFKVTTKTVVVDVVVTDNKGHVVRGLQEQDFKLREDGQFQDIRHFDVTAQEETDAKPQDKPQEKKKEKSTAEVSNRQNANSTSVLLLDLLNTPLAQQERAWQQVVNFLKTKPAGTRFALCAITPARPNLRILQGFTDDKQKLLAAAMGQGSPQASAWQTGEASAEQSRAAVTDLSKEGLTGGWASLLQGIQNMQAQQEVDAAGMRSQTTLDVFTRLAKYLTLVRGRKSVIWLSGAFPLSLIAGSNSSNPMLDNPNFGRKIKLATNLLADGEVSVYPVDVRGLNAGGQAGNMSAGLAPTGPGQSQAPGYFSQTGLDTMSASEVFQQQKLQEMSVRHAETQAMNELAVATGGRAFYNTNGIEPALKLAQEEGSNYYALTYNTSNKNFDGKFRRINVSVEGKQYHLAYRPGYFALNPEEHALEQDSPARQRAVAMQYGTPPARQLLFSVKVVPVGEKRAVNEKPAAKGSAQPEQSTELQRYAIDYSLEGSQLNFTEQPGGTYQSAMSLLVASFDRNGSMLTGTTRHGRTDLERDVYQKVSANEFRVHQEVDIPVHAASMRVGVQDDLTGRLGTVDIQLPIAPSKKTKPSLPPIEAD